MYKYILKKNRGSIATPYAIIKYMLWLVCNVASLPLLSAQGVIMLEKQTPSTAVVVTATQEVVLKPGFHATGASNSSFNAKIGTSNSLSPLIQVASGSTITIPTSPSTGQNYILAKTYLLPSDDSPTMNAVQYFDGLGRPTQTINAGITPSGADLVSHVGYDDVGRENKKFLAVAIGGNFGLYTDDSSIGSATTTLYGADNRPYAETLLEASPLNRVTGQKNPGDDWNNHYKKVSYNSNGSEIFYFSVTSDNKLQKGTNYAAATLYKTITTDEDDKLVTEYKDKLEHVVMTQSSSDANTYYVYNDLNQLSYVLPPGFIDGMSSTTLFDDTNTLLKQFAYVYRYDERGNCIYKKLPGCTPIYMAYDNANRMVLSQDGNQRKKLLSQSAQWAVTKYDSFGRTIFTGLMYRNEMDSTMNYKSIRDVISNIVVTESYTGFVTATPLTINYYDNYGFLSSSPSGLAYQIVSGYDKAYPATATSASDLSAIGMLTGTRTYFLDGSGSNTVAMYYDDKGRVVQTRATNHLGGYDLVYNQYDFTGKLLSCYKTHGINGASDTYKELYTNTYDNGQRLKTTTYSLNGTTATLVSNDYDELGRLQIKKIGNGIDATTYSYNIQGHITEIKGNKFSENLYYNTNTANLPAFTPNFNGNISGMKWNVADENLGYQRAYSFKYDDLNRLTNSVYSGNNGSATVSGTLDKYTEIFDYQNDKMGKLKALTRYENGLEVENLGLTYQGAQLMKVDNGLSHFVPYGSELFRDYDNHIPVVSEYSYDTNGNMLYDANGGVSKIQYNVLNLPDKIYFTAGHRNQYTYDAGGQKLRTVNYTVHNVVDIPLGTITDLPTNPSDYTTLTTDYIGNMIYQNGALQEVLLPEGYCQNGIFYYYLKDHLGDNRITINSSGVVVEKSHYYPSGTRFFAESTNNSLNPLPYRYNNKEMEGMNGLNQMDYGARRRFSWAPIWTAVDPLAEKYPSISPYVYCADNPVIYVDPNGEYILGFKSSMHFNASNCTLGNGKSQSIYKLNYLSNSNYSAFSSPNYQSAGNFITDANVPDKITYNGSPNDPLPKLDNKNGYYPGINSTSNANRTGTAVGAAVEFLANGAAGAINSSSKNNYIDVVNSKEAFSMAFNVVMGNSKMINEAFGSVSWSSDFKTLIQNGKFDVRNFQADVMNYITDGNINMDNFKLKGFGGDFNLYKNAVYQAGERLLQLPGVNLNVPEQNTLQNNVRDTYIYLGR